MLSPIYKYSKRGGFWFCPNQTYGELAYTKERYPELWGEIKELSKEPNVVSQGFKYGITIDEIEEKIEKIIKQRKGLNE